MPRELTTWPILATAVAAVVLPLAGCDKPAPRSPRGRASQGTLRHAQAEILLAGVGETLNELPDRIDMKLIPAQPLLTARTSDDGREVLATVTLNPESPETGINHLRLATGNANFSKLGVRPLDVVRLYTVIQGEEAENRGLAERGLEERVSIELTIRRLDSQDPANGLILMGSLNQLVEIPERIEIWRYSDKRMEQIEADLTRYERLRLPAVGWEPSADRGALGQLVERANQWLRSLDDDPGAWRPMPLVAELPAETRSAKGVAAALEPENLSHGLFAEYEGRLLQQAVWMRDISDWARGAAVTDAEMAAALFAWTVRNVQLDDPVAARSIHFPWQAVMSSHGSANHRLWVFAELCRQQGIATAVVALGPGADDPPTRELAAALVEGELLLFDAEYGLPLPGTEGPATLAELKASGELLRQFDLPGAPYPLQPEEVRHATAQMVASPLQLTRRAKLLEDALEGTQIVALAADAPALQQRLAAAGGVDAVALWPGAMSGLAESYDTRPSTRLAEIEQFRPLAQLPELWKARTLHFQGFKDVPRELRDDPLAEPTDGHRGAIPLYQHPRVRASDAQLAALDPKKQAIYGASKQAASFWLSLLSYDRGKYAAARRWAGERTLDAYPEGRYAEGARYVLARALEQLAVEDPPRLAEARALLEATPRDAPAWAGNQVLARQWARQLESPAAETAEESPAPAPPAGESGAGESADDRAAASQSP